MNQPAPTIIKRAEFNPDVRKYWLLSGAVVMMVTVIGIPLILLWYLFGMWITGKYLSRMECILTEKSLIVKKGVLNRIEKTVPLDKITDLGLKQGPIMRIWDIKAISVETAGTSGPGALIQLYGIRDTDDFRDDVLAQRDRMLASAHAKSGSTTEVAAPEESVRLLREIRDALLEMKASK